MSDRGCDVLEVSVLADTTDGRSIDDLYPLHRTMGKKCGRLYRIAGLMFGALCVLAVGILIGWFAHVDDDKIPDKQNPSSAKQTLDTGVDAILTQLNKENIRANLRNYTSNPRLAGSVASLQLADQLADTWRKNGLESVRTPTYNVLLSYPNKSQPNYIEVILDNGTSTGIRSAAYEKPLDEEGNNTDVVPPYNSFAPSGTVEGDLVYVNYGRHEDFQYLVKKLSMDLTGTIGIARYGKIFRGNKVKQAQLYNMSGLVMYTDPSDFNMGNSSVYPDSWWMPGSGVQRGTVGDDGDLLTPFYPATDYAHRRQKENVSEIKIPAQPISYGDAMKFLRRMDGIKAPDGWQGALPIEYKVGPGFADKTLKVRLTVNNYEVQTPVKNVIGYIKGGSEPDRYVLMGNHHDTWVFGAIDPLSGAAVLTELTRVLGTLLQQGHRPRRTIVFCSWAAEEQGLIGSTEWVEEHMKLLYERAVAYLNVDYAVDYTDVLAVGVSPLLQDVFYKAAKQVPNPEPSRAFPTLYDIWKNRTAGIGKEPSVYYSLGSGSDMATFYQRAGVPSADFWYTYDENRWDILSYPLYHSSYETFRMFTHYIDPSFNYTVAVAQLLGLVTWNLANQRILEFDVRRYSAAIESFIVSLEEEFGLEWSTNHVNIDALKGAARNFTIATEEFHKKLSKVHFDSDLVCRMVNDRLIQLERAFIDPEGLPGRPIYKHVMFAPSKYDSYSDNSFPGIVDTMHEIRASQADLWHMLKQQVYVATYTIQSAALTLADIGL